MKIKGTRNGQIIWWDGQYWTPNESDAAKIAPDDVERILRVTNANNRFLDYADRVTANPVESK